MRFLLFNLAVVAALFYLFSADRSGLEIGKDHRENPLQAMRQELESLARDIADGRRSSRQTEPESAAAEMPKDDAQVPRARVVDPAPGEPKDQPIPATPTRAEAPSAEQDAAQAPQTLDENPHGSRAAADPIGPLPRVDDPAVAQRRAEVLAGGAPLDDSRGETPVKPGLPMSPEERLRKLYSLAEEMELLYVSKMTR